MKKKGYLLLTCFALIGCNNNKGFEDTKNRYDNYVSNVGFEEPLNTFLCLSMYNEEACNEAIGKINPKIAELHKISSNFSQYNGVNNIYSINNSNTEVEISNDLKDLLQLSFKMFELTEGYYNPFCGDLLNAYGERFANYNMIYQLWNGDSTKPMPKLADPDHTLIDEIVGSIPTYNNYLETCILNNNLLSIDYESYAIDLGGIAKGYALEKTSEILDNDYPNNSYMFSGGSSSIVLSGNNPLRDDGSYNIATVGKLYNSIRKENVAVINLTGHCCLSTSGTYEQFYINDNDEYRHHIINPFTGFSENKYINLTLLSNDRADVLDALSTALFSITNDNDLLRIINKVETYFNINIKVMYTIEKNNKFEIHADSDFKPLIVGFYNNTLEDVILIENEN